MLYEVQVAPYLDHPTVLEADGYTGRKDFKYPLLVIDQESYLAGVVENSDEYYLTAGRLVHNLQIGRYCSIANGAYFLIGRGKDFVRVTTSAAKVFHQNRIAHDFIHREKGSVIIQNDVWLGRKVSVMSGVTIHNGAVVAANSHVVKDVPAYAIVGGNPAKVIGYRFDEETIAKLQTIQWWYWEEEKIKQNAAYFDDIHGFCERFYEEAKAEADRVLTCPLDLECKDRYCMLLDYADPFPVTFNVLEEFFEKYREDPQKELALFWFDHEEIQDDDFIQKVNQLIHQKAEQTKAQCSVLFMQGNLEDLKGFFPMIRHLIINRRIETILLMCYAELYGRDIEVISGVDIPVF